MTPAKLIVDAHKMSLMAKAPVCGKCGCEITYRERSEGNGLCWICARNQRDRNDARRAD